MSNLDILILFMAEENLKNKTIKGVGWSAVDNISQYGISFLISIILARLLTPEDYGLIGIITIFTSVCNVLINAGFSTALIRKNDCDEDDYNTVFVTNFCISVVLYLVIFLCAPFISAFFYRNELTDLIRVSSLGMIIGAIALVPMTRLTKRIDFKSQTYVTLISTVVGGIVGISMALGGYGVWSLVYSNLLSISVRTVFLFFYDKWIPVFRFSSKSFHDLFGFGWKLMASGILDSVWKQLYQVVVGKFYSPAALGQYTRAIGFSQLFSSNLSSVVQRVTYPVLSSIQEDKSRMVSAYRQIIKSTMFITAISMFFIGAISEPLLYCLIGPQWHDAALFLTLICISESTYPLHSINLNMLEIQGRSDLFLGLEIVKKIIAICPLFVGAVWGILPMLYVNLLTTIISYFLNSHYSGKLIGYSSFSQLRDVAPSYGIAILVAISVYFLKYLPLSFWIILPLQIIVGLVVFLVVCNMINNEEYKQTQALIMSLYNKMVKKS